MVDSDGRSISARIRDFYESLPEADQSVLVVDPARGDAPTRFNTAELQAVLRFILTAGGSGLAQSGQLAFAEVVLPLEAAIAVPDGPRGFMTERFSSPYAFGAAVQTEQDRVLAMRKWRVSYITVAGVRHPLYFRDVLDAGLDALQSADDTVVEGRAPHPTADGERRRSESLDSDLFLDEQADARQTHGEHAYVMGVHLRSDETIISWSGSQPMYPVRAHFLNARGSRWVNVAQLPHIPKVVGNGRNARARLQISDARNDLLQRCYALILARFIRASEYGVQVTLPTIGPVFLVPRVLGLLVDQVEERSLVALIGSQCTFNCTHCMVTCATLCTSDGGMAQLRPVVSSLEAEVVAAEARLADGRPRTRVALGRAISALPFALALGAVHGLGTGRESLYRVISFDALHVWKLGVLRLLAQRLPALMDALCPDGQAVLGTVQEVMDVLNWRGFELGRLCRASSTTPGYE